MVAGSEPARRAAAAVDQARLWRRHMDMAKIGAMAETGGIEGHGVNRQALSAEDAGAGAAARWAAARGYDLASTTSAICSSAGEGAIRRGTGDGRLAHGQPADRRPLRRHVRRAGRVRGAGGARGCRREDPAAGDAVAWTNEEGSRFQPGAMGSAVFAGRIQARRHAGAEGLEGRRAEGRAGRDPQGRAGAAARRHAGLSARRLCRGAYRAGPAAGERAQDHRRGHRHPGQPALHRRGRGEEAHAGTTPRAARKDAYAAATRIAAAMYEATTDADDTLRFTIGRVEVSPGSPNTVPGKVELHHRHAPSLEIAVLEDAKPAHRAAAASRPRPAGPGRG